MANSEFARPKPKDALSSSSNHKPLHYTKSAPNMEDTSTIERLLILEEGRRSRSQSEPLSYEAVQIAKELRRASDLFNTSYDVPSSTRKSARDASSRRGRRITVGGSAGESLRHEIEQARAKTNESRASSVEGTPV